jgi:hypothetical protein
MKRRFALLLPFVLIGRGFGADAGADSTRATHIDPEVLQEFIRRTALPEGEARAILASCDANQQNMNFCAYRDQVAAEMEFKQAVAAKEKALPACKVTIEARVVVMEKSRDASCECSTTQAWGDGSMKPAARATCAAAETLRMTREIRKIRRCPTRRDGS